MIIAGGLYKESSLVPRWSGEYGSGGRAAAAVVALASSTVLHTYSPVSESSGLDRLKQLGVDLRVHPASHGVAFAYFHPLSHPHIEPPRSLIVQHPPIDVSGDAILRFGFLEGDAIVKANRAVYDPQTSLQPVDFIANGSHAEELALVMNEDEVRALAGNNDVQGAALLLLQRREVTVVVVKAGARGALVVERGGATTEVPPYRSPRILKIGTGDIFSSIFALEWAERKRSAGEAADLASRHVAAYCSSGQLPLRSGAGASAEPIVLTRPPVVCLDGATNTVGCRFVMEEARYALLDLGAVVVCPELDTNPPASELSVSTALVIADGSQAALQARLRRMKDAGISVVLLDESCLSEASGRETWPARLCVTRDFASAIYFAVWMASS